MDQITSVGKIQSVWFLVIITLCSILSVHAEDDTQPNILFMMLDDMGWNEVEYHGTNKYETPFMNWMHENGVTLMNHYSHASCIPTRAAFITSRYPETIRIHANGWGKGYNPLNLPTIGNHLQMAGYKTHIMGKWHIGYHNNASTPTSRGFDTFYGQYINGNHMYLIDNKWPSGSNSVLAYDEYNLLVDNEADGEHKNIFVEPDGLSYSTSLYADRAIKIIEEAHAAETHQPWFMPVWFTPPHSPFITPPGTEDACAVANALSSDDGMRCKMVWHVDMNMQRIYDTLDNLGELENTLIVVTSDNGAGQAYYNYPLRGGKFSAFDGGNRVPAWIYHKGQTSKRTVSDLVTIEDWQPTFMRIAGMNLRNNMYQHGYDFSGVIYNEGAVGNRNEVLLYMSDTCSVDHAGMSRPYCGAIRVDDYVLFALNENDPEFDTKKEKKLGKNSWLIGSGDDHGVLVCDETAKPLSNGPDEQCFQEDTPCVFNVEEDPCQYTNDYESVPSETITEILDRLGYWISMIDYSEDFTDYQNKYSQAMESLQLDSIGWVNPWLQVADSQLNQGRSKCSSTGSYICACEYCEPLPGSCVDACDGQSLTGTCYCDQSCLDYNDCCYDMKTECGFEVSGVLDKSETATSCYDGIQNQGETGIDCGGPCYSCINCWDGIQNGDEEDIDCGGSCPWDCEVCKFETSAECDSNGCIWYDTWGCRTEEEPQDLCTLFTTEFLCRNDGCNWLYGQCSYNALCTQYGFDTGASVCSDCGCSNVANAHTISATTEEECAVEAWGEGLSYIDWNSKAGTCFAYHIDECDYQIQKYDFDLFFLEACEDCGPEMLGVEMICDHCKCKNVNSVSGISSQEVSSPLECGQLAKSLGKSYFSMKKNTCLVPVDEVLDCVDNIRDGAAYFWSVYHTMCIDETQTGTTTTTTEAPAQTQPNEQATETPSDTCEAELICENCKCKHANSNKDGIKLSPLDCAEYAFTQGKTYFGMKKGTTCVVPPEDDVENCVYNNVEGFSDWNIYRSVCPEDMQLNQEQNQLTTETPADTCGTKHVGAEMICEGCKCKQTNVDDGMALSPLECAEYVDAPGKYFGVKKGTLCVVPLEDDKENCVDNYSESSNWNIYRTVCLDAVDELPSTSAACEDYTEVGKTKSVLCKQEAKDVGLNCKFQNVINECKVHPWEPVCSDHNLDSKLCYKLEKKGFACRWIDNLCQEI